MSEIKRIKPKILILSLAYFPFVGGAEVAVAEITKRLEADFDFDLITANLDGKQSKEEVVGNLRVFRVGKGLLSKYLYPIMALRKASLLHQQKKYDMVWGIMAFWAGLTALKFKEKYPGVKYLLTLQSGDSDSFIKKRTWFWAKRYAQIYSKADHIQAISQWLADRARKFGYKGDISLVPNGVSLDKVQKEKSDVSRQNKKIVLTTSRLVAKNGVEDLIRAVKDIDCKLLIVGDGVLKNKLELLVNDLGIKDKVEFKGYVAHDKLDQYYLAADVFVRPSLSEGFGVSFIEAMYYEVPVIATPVGGIVDFLQDRQTGWFVKVEDVNDLAKKIEYVLDDKNRQEVKSVTAVAKKMVDEKYSWHKISAQMAELFNKQTEKR